MELRSGYKQTEVGLVPEDWRLIPLGDFLHFRNGVNAAKEAYGAGTPFVNVLEVITYTHIHSSQIAGRVMLAKSMIDSYSLRRGDLLFNRTSETQEEVGLTSVYADDEEAVFGGFVICGRPNTGILDAVFSGYAFRAPVVRRQITARGQGAIRANIGQADLRQVQALLPLPGEQRAIGVVLSDADALIGALDKLIAKKRDLKQAAMQQLLTGRTRLPGFSSKWDETTLGEIGECIIGLTYKPENVVDHGLLVLRSSNVQDGHLAFEDNVYVNVSVQDRLITRQGDILICVRNGSRALIGKCAMIDERGAGQTFGAFMSIYRTRYSQFIFYAFQSHDIQRQIRDNIGATINQITNKDMKALRLRLPPESEQDAIVAVLSDMDREITILQARHNKTRVLKQGMIQELLTGKTRLI